MCGVCVTWCFCDGIQALCLSFSVVWGLFSPLAMEWDEEMGGGGRRGEQKCLLTDGILTELSFLLLS